MIVPAPLQTVYNQYEFPGQVGQVATQAEWNIDNRIADDPLAAGIGFGLAVCQGSLHGDKSASLGQASGADFVGITCADPTLPNLNDVSGQFTDAFSDGDNMAVLTLGDIWVKPATHVNAGDPIYFNSVTGELGNSAISNAVQITGSKWQTSQPRPSGELVLYNGLAVARLGIMS